MDIVNDAEFTIAKLARLIRRRKLSPVELVRAVLARVERLEPQLNAFITVTEDLALVQARQAEQHILKKGYLGPLHGIPFTLKDVFETSGVRTTAGSKILQRYVPDDNATVVNRLFESGAVLIGKNNLHEFAYGATNVNPHYGPVHNPWDLARISGGSSGGSAASVVAALSLASVGTDTGGSIRIPAAACGCVGLKPTYGLVPLSGVIPLARSLDHVGPICRCVEDAALLLNALTDNCRPNAGRRGIKRDYLQDLHQGLRGLHIGVPKQFFFKKIEGEVRRNVTGAIATLEQQGADVREVDLRWMAETADLHGVITVAEALQYHWKWMKHRHRDYGADLLARMREKKDLPALDYLQAQEDRRRYAEAFDEVLQSVHALAVPTLPTVAPRIEEEEIGWGRFKEDVRSAMLRLTRPANLAGLPALTLPCGFSSERMPIGLQLIGRRFGEDILLRAAYGYEQSSPWHLMFPPDPVEERKGD